MGKKDDGQRCFHGICSCIGLQCCSDIDADNPVPYLVPNKDRFCTDIIWCFGLIFILISQGYLISYANDQGSDTRWLFHGIDINGTVCDDSYPSDPPNTLAMWPFVIYYHIIICTDSCNNTETDPRLLLPYTSEE
eukprot:306624_1